MESVARSIPKLVDLHGMFFNEDVCIQFLYQVGILQRVIDCPKCDRVMHLNTQLRRFRCNRTSCRNSYSFRMRSFFHQSKMLCSEMLLMGYFWLSGASWSTVKTITGHSEGTITAFFSHFRILVGSMLDEDDGLIGGEGVEVQVDETKLGNIF